jgi:hypothetical protein
MRFRGPQALNDTYKNRGGGFTSRQRYPPLTTHPSLLTLPIIPLHYAFEAQHDS